MQSTRLISAGCPMSSGWRAKMSAAAPDTCGAAMLVPSRLFRPPPGTGAVIFSPGARPPQTIMLAVPPQPIDAWTIDDLAEIVGETLDLAKVRMVDLSSVAWAGRFIPTLYLTDGDVSTGLDLPIREIVQLADARAKAVVDP